jgi:hypothetical protein
VVYYQSYEFNRVLDVVDMGFMVGKSSTAVAAWNAAVVSRRENLWFGVVNRARTSLNYSYIVITQLFSMIYCIGSRYRPKIVRSLLPLRKRRNTLRFGTIRLKWRTGFSFLSSLYFRISLKLFWCSSFLIICPFSKWKNWLKIDEK